MPKIQQPEIAEPKSMAPETSSDLEVVAVPSKLEVGDSSKLTLRIVKIGDFGEKVVFDWSDMPEMKKSPGPPTIWGCVFSFMVGIFIGGGGLLSGFVVTAASVVNLAKMSWSCACSPFKQAVTWFKTRSS